MMVGHAAAHVRSGSWRGTRYRSADGQGRPVTATVARNAFCLGFTERLGQRLAEAQVAAPAGPGRGAAGARMAQGRRRPVEPTRRRRPAHTGRSAARRHAAVELALRRRRQRSASTTSARRRRRAPGGAPPAVVERRREPAAGRQAAESYGARSVGPRIAGAPGGLVSRR